MGSVLQRLYRWTGRFYLLLFGLFDAGSAVVICFATVGLFALYTNISIVQFWEAVAFSELSVAIALVLTASHAVKQIRPVTGGSVLEGRDVEVTVMFVDIRDFTPFAER